MIKALIAYDTEFNLCFVTVTIYQSRFIAIAVQERYEELLEAEDDWNTFLASADTALTAGLLPPLREGELINDKIVLNTVG